MDTTTRQLATEIADAYTGPGRASVVDDKVLGGPVVQVKVGRVGYLLTVGPEGSLHAILRGGRYLAALATRRGEGTAAQTASELAQRMAALVN